MGLIEDEIMELRKLVADVVDEKVSLQNAAVQLSVYSQVAKRERLIFDMIKLSQKSGTWEKAIRKNLIGKGTAIQAGEHSQDKMVCPQLGETLIDHERCLDFSGDQNNIDECRSCVNFKITRGRIK